MSRHKHSAFVALLKGDEVLTVTEFTGQIGLPGGRSETGESPMTTARREFREEVKAVLPRKRYDYIGLGTRGYELQILVARIDDAEAKTIADQSSAAGGPTDVRSWAWTRRDAVMGLKLWPHIRAGLMMLDAVAASPLSYETEWRGSTVTAAPAARKPWSEKADETPPPASQRWYPFAPIVTRPSPDEEPSPPT